MVTKYHFSTKKTKIIQQKVERVYPFLKSGFILHKIDFDNTYRGIYGKV